MTTTLREALKPHTSEDGTYVQIGTETLLELVALDRAASPSGSVGEEERLGRENAELRAYLKAFCAATIDPEDRGTDVQQYEANPFVEYQFTCLCDDEPRPDRVLTGGQVRRAMELVGFDKLKIEPSDKTISEELTEARDLRLRIPALEGAVRIYAESEVRLVAQVAALTASHPARPGDGPAPETGREAQNEITRLRMALMGLDIMIFSDPQVIDRAGEWRSFIEATLAATQTTKPETGVADAAGVGIDHEFKSAPDVFWPAARGTKTFEFRKDDRGGYHVGQIVRLRCYEAGVGYTGDQIDRVITNVLYPGQYGLQDGYCILSLRPIASAPATRPGDGVETSDQIFDRLRIEHMVREWCAPLSKGPPSANFIDGLIGVMRLRFKRIDPEYRPKSKASLAAYEAIAEARGITENWKPAHQTKEPRS